MRLQQIKLAGFKSFVEPTKVVLGSSMAAIVGPNGCGKSNLIDAVRWVLGESSARHLRGDAMTDVIFNGATGRSPVSRASVELTFDNRGGEMGAAYASYAEIAVRREVTRDGSNDYYLNGHKCRRRDITDLFLGTGLGPRSYAIVEQGMITRLIESRPQELRGFLEEAAGISKYKERRRETETRMRHCRENLERVADIRTELEQQLARLARQALAARQFRELRQRQRQLTARQTATEWHALQAQVQRQHQHLKETELALSHLEQQLAECDRDKLEATSQHEQLRQQQQQLSQQRMRLAGDISGLQQQQQYRRQQCQQQQQQADELAAELDQLTRRVQADQCRLEQCQQEQARLEALQHELQQQLPPLQASVAERQRLMQRQQQQSAQLHAQLTELGQQRQLHQTRAQAIEQQLARTQQQLILMEAEGDPLPALRRQVIELTQQEQQQQQRADESEHQLQHWREQTAQLSQQCDQQRQHQVALQARIDGLGEQNTMLEQLWRDAAKGDETNAIRLLDVLRVSPGWELAVETVLRHWLDACIVQEWPPVGVSKGVREHSAEKITADSLAARVDGPAMRHFLGRIHCVDDLQQAKARLPELPVAHTVITRSGQWLGPEWFVDASQQPQQDAPLQLKARLELGRQQLKQLQDALEPGRATLRELDTRLQQAQAQQRSTHELHQIQQSDLREQTTQLALAGQRLQHAEQRQTERQQQHARLSRQRLEDTRQLEVVSEDLQLLGESATELKLEQELQQSRLEVCAHQFQAEQQQLARLNEQFSQRQQALERCRQQQQSLQELLQRESARQAPLGKRLDEVRQALHRVGESDDAELALEQALAQQLALEEYQQQLDEGVSREQQRLRQQEQQLAKLRAQQLELQQLRADTQVERERVDSRASLLKEQLCAQQLDVEALLATDSPESDPQRIADELEEIERRLGKLGAVNLAAEEEHGQLQQRNEYLRQQDEDLQQALATLEQAIVRIDRETRSRFKRTFERVNQDLGELFPKVFGGGTACLELTSDEPLEAGVSIMARPPGKRNATIALLSGGEKALTALALIFAFFRLNPAPFCMLDEVDAPLDEVNVGRFCTLVKEMSDTVQFVYISHNKVSMEMATELIGVTMREAGVSRVVSVDITEAVAMAENS